MQKKTLDKKYKNDIFCKYIFYSFFHFSNDRIMIHLTTLLIHLYRASNKKERDGKENANLQKRRSGRPEYRHLHESFIPVPAAFPFGPSLFDVGKTKGEAKEIATDLDIKTRARYDEGFLKNGSNRKDASYIMGHCTSTPCTSEPFTSRLLTSQRNRSRTGPHASSFSTYTKWRNHLCNFSWYCSKKRNDLHDMLTGNISDKYFSFQ